MSNENKQLRTDNLGRYILDLKTPLEKSFGKVFGCFGIILLILAPFLFISILQNDFGILSKLLRLIGLILLVGFFNFCRKSIDCYYVLDAVGGQMLYHFSAILMVSEDPIANIENINGVGVTHGGYDSYAVVVCCDNGKLIRISDFISVSEANSIATKIADLLDIYLICAEPNEKISIGVENGWMIKKTDENLISTIDKETTSGCITGLFLSPYLFIPILSTLMISLFIVTGSGEKRDLAYYMKNRKYDVVDVNGKKLTFKDIRKKTTKNLNETNDKSKAGLHKSSNESKDTIVPGKGIIGFIEINELMETVFKRFNLEMPPMTAELNASKPGYNRQTRKFIPPKRHRQNLLDGKISVVFTENRNNQMKVSRIEIFRGNELPYITGDKIGFSSSAKKNFGLGDGKGKLSGKEDYLIKRKFPDANFFTTSRKVGNNFEQGYGINFDKEGIAYTFYGDKLYEITITEKKR